MLRRFAVPILIVGALLLVGSAALVVAGSLPPRAGPAAGAVSPQQSDPEATPTPTPTATPTQVVKPPTPTPVLKLEEAAPVEIEGSAGVELETEPKSAPKDSGRVQVKGGGQSGVQVRGASAHTVSKNTIPDGESGGEGTVYTWQDGDREMRVVLQNDAVDPDADASTKGDAGATVKSETSGSKGKRGGSSVLPEFRSESGGGMMKLPGGVILLLDEGWDETQVNDFFTSNDISSKDVTEIEFLDNAYLVETDAGFPSLNLANDLAGKTGVVSSSPNWERERVAK